MPQFMPQFALKLIRLFFGLALYAIGIVCTINAHLGLSPWDVFHQGLSHQFGITMGQASICIGLVVVLLDWRLGERVGLGTLCNMLFIGLFVDVLMLNHLIPIFDFLPLQVLMLVSGMMIIGLATYFYISASMGSGPRDGLMVALTKKTGRSVRFIRNSIELSVLIIGTLLKGQVGFGTVVMVFAGGYFVQFAFKLFHFDVKAIQHTYLDDYFKPATEKL